MPCILPVRKSVPTQLKLIASGVSASEKIYPFVPTVRTNLDCKIRYL